MTLVFHVEQRTGSLKLNCVTCMGERDKTGLSVNRVNKDEGKQGRVLLTRM